MKRPRLAVVIVALALVLGSIPVALADNWQATGSQGVVVAGSGEAVEAGLEILKPAACNSRSDLIPSRS